MFLMFIIGFVMVSKGLKSLVGLVSQSNNVSLLATNTNSFLLLKIQIGEGFLWSETELSESTLAILLATKKPHYKKLLILTHDILTNQF